MEKARVELRILSVITYIAIALALAGCAFTPYLLARYRYEQTYILPVWVIALSFIAAVWQLRGIVRLVTSGDPFSRRNVKYLKRISWCCFAVALASLGMIPIYFTMVKVLMALLALTGGLIMRVLAYVFHLAAVQKEEMDMVI